MSEQAKTPIKITETILRDAHQSLIATRMPTDFMLPIVEKMDKVGYHSVECWGGATFDASLRFLKEDPWDRLRKLRDGFKNTKLQMLFRGQNILGYRPYADDVVDAFVQKSIANGIDIIRIFDCLNDIRNLQTAVKAANKDYLSQEAISSRNNHLVLPVKAGNKNIVKGIVHAVSATGQTMFIEPEIIVSMNNQLVHARDDELREINRILTELSRMVKDNYDLLHENQELMVEIDVIFAKAGYGVQIDGVVPDVCEDYSSFSLIKARHPLIDKDKVVANSIILNEPKRMLLISGSNTGGKTVVLKTAGLLSLMALCGMAVPCNQAVVPMFDQICVDLGDEQSIEQSLSTFSSHMKRLVEITNDVSEKSLVLLDEIGSGTDPKEGQSIAEAILRYLHKVNPLIVASTHYSGLKEFAKNEEYILVAAVEFDQERMIPTYRLIEGSVGNSYAIEISSRLGLKEEIVELAYQIKENSLTDSDKLLEKLQDELTQVQIERDNLELLTNFMIYKLNDCFYQTKNIGEFDDDAFVIVKPIESKNWHPAMAVKDSHKALNAVLLGKGDCR